MGFLVYEEFGVKTVRAPSVPISQWGIEKVMAAWETHVGNRFYLEFMASKGTFLEKAQARRELEICDRKLTFWKRHPAWSQQVSDRITERLRREWK